MREASERLKGESEASFEHSLYIEIKNKKKKKSKYKNTG